MGKFSVICLYTSLSGLVGSIVTSPLGLDRTAMGLVLLAGAAITVYFAGIIWSRLTYKAPPANTSGNQLDLYVGTYTSQDLRMKIHVTKGDNGILLAQATGQLAFPLHEIDENVFDYSVAGLIMEFRPDNNKFVLIQNGGYFPFIKEA